MSGLPYGCKVDKATLNVDRCQLHPNLVADIQALDALHDLALNRNVERSYSWDSLLAIGPLAFIWSAHVPVPANADRAAFC
jgi:hypothetical protein